MPSQFDGTAPLLGQTFQIIKESPAARYTPRCHLRVCVIAFLAFLGVFFLVQLVIDKEFIGEAVINAALWHQKRRNPQRYGAIDNLLKADDEPDLSRFPPVYTGDIAPPPSPVAAAHQNQRKLGNGKKEELQTNTSDSYYFSECFLPKIDPWDPVMMPYIDPTYQITWERDCVPTTPKLTYLSDGYVLMDKEAHKNGTECEFRCLYHKNDYDLMFGEWKGLNNEPDCDVIETHCKHKDLNNGTHYYTNLHVQVCKRLAYKEKRKLRPPPNAKPDMKGYQVAVELPPNFEPKEDEEKRRLPDVHVIIFDSTAHTQMLRTLPKTMTFLRNRMDAVPFPHLNKNGLNSRPNGYGMFFGWQSWKVEANPMGPEYVPPRDLWDLGGVFLDKEPFVGFEYREKKYRTSFSEDWAKGVFNWPGNWGFDRQPTDHYLRPFHIRLEKYADENDTLSGTVYGNSCKEAHTYILDYLKDFIFVYDDVPKFSISWMSCISHNHANGLYRVDDYLFDFFRTYEKSFENSFVFLMGDHGLRFGGIRWTPPGEVEDNNPALFITLPRHLRYNNNLFGIMRENSRQLITHFDIHATLLDIARVTFETVPGNGQFWGFMRVVDRGFSTEKISLISTRFPRLNEYGTQAFCIEDFVARPYCYCKSLLNASTTTTQAPTNTTLAPTK